MSVAPRLQQQLILDACGAFPGRAKAREYFVCYFFFKMTSPRLNMGP